VWLRATNALGNQPADLMEEFVGAGFDSVEARNLVAYDLFGVAPEGRTLTTDAAAAGGRSVLFAGAAATECSSLEESRYRDAAAWATAMSLADDGAWRSLGDAVGELEDEHQAPVLRA